MLKTDKNPGGLPLEVFNDLRAKTLADRAQFQRYCSALLLYGANRPGSKVSEGLLNLFGCKQCFVVSKASMNALNSFQKPTLLMQICWLFAKRNLVRFVTIARS